MNDAETLQRLWITEGYSPKLADLTNAALRRLNEDNERLRGALGGLYNATARQHLSCSTSTCVWCQARRALEVEG